MLGRGDRVRLLEDAPLGKSRTRSGKVVKAAVYTYTAVFEPAIEGGYTVTVPMLPGVITEGDTLVEARSRVKEAIAGYVKVLRKHRQPVPVERRTQVGRPIAARVVVTI
jgi:antitoxin HicB